MKNFRKLSSIAILLFAFVYPPSLAEAKASSLTNSLNQQSVGGEANLVEGSTGELLIAQRRYERRRFRRYERRRVPGRRFRREQFRRRQFRREQFRRQQFRREQYRRRQYRRRPGIILQF